MTHALGHDGVQLCTSHNIYRNAVLARKIAQLMHGASVQSVREQDAVDAAPRLDCLDDRVASGKNMGGLFCCALFRMFCKVLLSVFFSALFRALFFRFHCAPPTSSARDKALKP